MSQSIGELMDYNLVLRCSKCKNLSPTCNFNKNKGRKSGYHNQCKKCLREYYLTNSDRIKNQSKKWIVENRERHNEHYRKYREECPKRVRQYFNEYERTKRMCNPEYKLLKNYRSRLNSALKSQDAVKNHKTIDLLGCSIIFLRNWLIFQFREGMTIENHGKVWVTDHCLPCASFNLLNEEELRKCFNWLNLRPMITKDNITKGAKVDYRLYLLQEIKAHCFLRNYTEQLGIKFPFERYITSPHFQKLHKIFPLPFKNS